MQRRDCAFYRGKGSQDDVACSSHDRSTGTCFESCIDAGRNFSGAADFATDEHARRNHGSVGWIFQDVFFRICRICHVQYACQHFTGIRRQQASRLLSDNRIDHQYFAWSVVYRSFSFRCRSSRRGNVDFADDQRTACAASADDAKRTVSRRSAQNQISAANFENDHQIRAAVCTTLK